MARLKGFLLTGGLISGIFLFGTGTWSIAIFVISGSIGGFLFPLMTKNKSGKKWLVFLNV